MLVRKSSLGSLKSYVNISEKTDVTKEFKLLRAFNMFMITKYRVFSNLSYN